MLWHAIPVLVVLTLAGSGSGSGSGSSSGSNSKNDKNDLSCEDKCDKLKDMCNKPCQSGTNPTAAGYCVENCNKSIKMCKDSCKNRGFIDKDYIRKEQKKDLDKQKEKWKERSNN
jgi:hypothetical protein